MIGQFCTGKVDVCVAPSTEGDLSNSHVCHILTVLQASNLRPCLFQAEVMANRSILVDLAVAQNSESELSRLVVANAQTKGGHSNEHITILKLYRSSFRALR